jgi:cytochrome c biogenesis protein CcdA
MWSTKFVVAETVKLIKIISLIATIAFGCVVVFFIWFAVVMWKDEERAAQKRDDMRSGKWDFGWAQAHGILRPPE